MTLVSGGFVGTDHEPGSLLPEDGTSIGFRQCWERKRESQCGQILEPGRWRGSFVEAGKMIFNIGDKKTKLLLSLAKTPLLFYPYYKYHLPLPSVLMIENTNHCNAECVMCPRDTLSRKRGFMDFGLFPESVRSK